MFDILRASFRTGIMTRSYPTDPDPAPPAFRGRPALAAARCDGAGACVQACPSGAVSLAPVGSGREWRIDLARCVFCGLCEEVCPNGAVALTNDFELAARRRADLVLRAAIGTASDATVASVPVEDAATLGRRLRAEAGVGCAVAALDRMLASPRPMGAAR